MNLGRARPRAWARRDWTAPEAQAFPTGLELASVISSRSPACPSSRAASTPTHRSCTRAAGVRSRADSVGQAERREHPFRLLVRDAGRREELSSTPSR